MASHLCFLYNYVVENDGPALLGRNWLQTLKLDWSTVSKVNSVDDVIDKYASVFDGTIGSINTEAVHIKTKDNAQPVFMRARPVPYAIASNVEETLDKMERDGIISKVSFTEWTTPIVVVPKKNDKIPICGDYRVTVNKEVEQATYPLPNPRDIFASLANGKKFSVIDFDKAYHQLEIDDDAKKISTINTRKGLYRFNRLLFGLSVSPLIFQKVMDGILGGIPNCVSYLDDILITGKSDAEHMLTSEKVLSKLRDAGIKLKVSKCKFFQDEVKYLGHAIDSKGLYVDFEKTKALMEAPVPTDVTQLQSFLGLVNYYGDFVKNLSSILNPFYSLLKKGVKFVWTDSCQKAFELIKQKLTNPSFLAHYDPTKRLILSCDASSYGLGAVISHIDDNDVERPVAFASLTLCKTENYSQIEREALSLMFEISKFHKYLYGRKVELETDHKPLVAIFGNSKSVSQLTASRLQRRALALSAYNYEIVYKKGSQNANAYLFSRLPLESKPLVSDCRVNFIDKLAVTDREIKNATEKDPILRKVVYYTINGWPAEVEEDLIPFKNKRDSFTIENGCLISGYRAVIHRTPREHT